MPQISAIEPQKKKPGRFNVFVDGQFAFGISELFLLENRLTLGRNLTPQEITKIISKEELSKMTDKALKFLSFRPRSEKEVATFITKKIANAQNIKYHQAKESLLLKQMIAKLKRNGYLNDREFAQWWLESRTKSHIKGPMMIKLELTQKGIEKEIIDSVLKSFPSQSNLAQKALAKKLKIWHNLPTLEFKKKVYSFLLRRGFGFDIAKEVFANLVKRR